MATTTVDERALIAKAEAAQAAARKLARLPTSVRNQALLNIAVALEQEQKDTLGANQKDYQAARAAGMNEAMLDRLLLTPERLWGMAHDVRRIAELPDPVGEIMESTALDNGLHLEKRRVPLGVIASIYESRPNVTVDIAALCLKSGNSCILRGGKESLNSNSALVSLIHRAITAAGIPEEAVQFVNNPDRLLVSSLLEMKEYISLLIPRGGADLIRFVAEHAAMPVVTGGIGVCHTYVDQAADLDMAASIIFNAKVQRPTVCNALDTVLVHSEIAPRCLPRIARDLGGAGVELHCDHRALSILGPEPGASVLAATEEDWGKEFLSLTAAVKVVDSLDEALAHIETYGSGHSDAIITQDEAAANRFLDEVDSCAVYVNASTRFTDGAQFGLGAEVGISTQKFHARGPMGLRELTSYKWVVRGTGQTRE
jgi:glutamate-5-semialdehyde dehydrogenase